MARSTHLPEGPGEAPLPNELAAVQGPVVMFFGLLRPYKGLDVLLEAWRGVDRARELWIVGCPRMPLEPLRALAGASVRCVPRFVSDAELPALFRRADVIVLPYVSTERFDSRGCSPPRSRSASRSWSVTSAASARWQMRARRGWWRRATQRALRGGAY